MAVTDLNKHGVADIKNIELAIIAGDPMIPTTITPVNAEKRRQHQSASALAQ
jgi:hypothetical protein